MSWSGGPSGRTPRTPATDFRTPRSNPSQWNTPQPEMATGPSRHLEYHQRRKLGLIKDTRKGTPPMTVEEYIERGKFVDLLDGKRFAKMEDGMLQLDGKRSQFVKVGRSTVISKHQAWGNRWLHLSNDPKSMPATQPCDVMWHRHIQEAHYHDRMRPVVASILNGDICYRDMSEVRIELPKPYTDLYCYAGGDAYWWRDWSLELRLRRDPRSVATGKKESGRNFDPIFAGWHNVEVFGIQKSDRTKLYVPVPEFFSIDWDASPVTMTPSPWFLHLFGSYVMDKSLPQTVTMSMTCIYCAEFSIFAFMRFLYVAQYGVYESEFNDSALKAPGKGILTWLPRRVRNYIDEVGIMNVLEGCDIDRAKALLAYKLSDEIDWSVYDPVIGVTGPYLHYNWNIGRLFDVPSRVRRVKSGDYGIDGRPVYIEQHLPHLMPVQRNSGKEWYTLDEAQVYVRNYDRRFSQDPPPADSHYEDIHEVINVLNIPNADSAGGGGTAGTSNQGPDVLAAVNAVLMENGMARSMTTADLVESVRMWLNDVRQVHTMRQDVQRLEQENGKLESDARGSTATVAALRKQVSDATAAHNDALNSERRDHQCKADELNARISQLEQLLAEATASNDSNSATIASLREKEKEARESALQQLREELGNEYNGRLVQERNKLAAAEGVVVQQSSAIAKLKSEVSEIASLRRTLSSTQHQLAVATDKIMDLEVKHVDKKLVESRLHDARRAKSRAEATVAELRNDVSAELDSIFSAVSKLRAAVDRGGEDSDAAPS